MGGAGHHHCDNKNCNNKVFYTANICALSPEGSETLGEFKALCKQCSEKYKIFFKLKVGGYKKFNLPAWVEKLPDNALLGSKDIMRIFGYSSTTSPTTMIEKGRLPKPDNTDRILMNGRRALRWSVGYLKSIKNGA